MGRRWSYHKETERRKWQNPEDILSSIDLKPGATFIDIGCGEGFFTIPAAIIIGKEGTAYALDANREVIRVLEKKARDEGLMNIVAKVGTAEDNIFCDECADIVFFGITLHDFDSPAKVLTNARRMLEPNGKLVNLDWKKEPLPIGPPMSVKFSEQQAAKLIQEAGFTITRIEDVGPYHYMMTAQVRES